MYDIVLLTESRYENPKDPDWYVQNILTEDGLVRGALERLGLNVGRFDWNGDFDWSQTKTALFRTTWDYFHKFEQFSNWLDEVKDKTKLINSYEQVKWNMDKSYLADLADRGIRVTETKYIHKGSEITLAQLIEETEWLDSVLKPTFSGAGRHTYKLHPGNIRDHESVFEELLNKEDLMLQPFMEQVPTRGEVAYIVIDGEVTHAVLKKAREGDFRVQDDFGGTVHDYDPNEKEIAFVERAIDVLPEKPLYARVDVIWDNNDLLTISELELIEPELWFRKNPEAADKLARAIIQRFTI